MKSHFMKNFSFYRGLWIFFSLGCGKDMQDGPLQPIIFGAINNLACSQELVMGAIYRKVPAP